MRLSVVALALLMFALPACNIPGTAGETVAASLRSGVDTMGDEDVLAELEHIGTSPHIQAILHQLTRDLIDTAAGAVRDAEIEQGLRALIAAAIQEVRSSFADVPGAIGESMDSLLTDAEALVTRVVRRTLHDVRAMIHGDEISEWVQDLVRGLMTELIGLASDELGQDSAERLGAWMRRWLGELLRDVELEESTERIARAAARGFSRGIADELRNDAGLGGALHEQTTQLGETLRTASHDAAQPWIFVVIGLGLILLVGGFFFYQAHRERVELKASLERDGNRTAREVVQEVQRKGIRVAVKERLPPPDGPSE